jgi:3-hydroxyisobutyrate dehydrogenase-like beta-hydroxyacid dehydrogenase
MANAHTNVGVIGTGTVGSAMTKALLAAGFNVTVHDKFKQAAEPLLTLGARWSDSPAALARSVTVLFTALPAPPHVRAAMEGPTGALSALKPGSMWIDHTSTDPGTSSSSSSESSSMHLGWLLISNLPST